VNITDWIRSFYPEEIAVNYIERLRAAIGACLGILFTSLLTYFVEGNASTIPFLIAPMGASAVLLFAVPSSPLAQPWSVLGGNMVAAFTGITCLIWIPNILLAASLAVGMSIFAMFFLRCLHPPGGAVALITVLGGSAIQSQGYSFVIFPVGINSLLLLVAAIIYNNMTSRQYPHILSKNSEVHLTSDTPPEIRFGFTSEDLSEVLKEYNQVVDVSRKDLESLLKQTEMHAYRRRSGEITCADIMSKDVVCVEFGTELEEAWTLLRKHKIKALPVIDRAKRVIGIITQIDFMKNANLEVYDSFEVKLRHFIRRTASVYSDKSEVVGQIMTSPAVTAKTDMHIIELIPLMTLPNVHHHIPVVDENHKIVGIVTQSDLVSALYHTRPTSFSIKDSL
jgi:CBS domain-containing membrane protein